MDQKEFEGEMKDCAIEKARRTKESEMKNQEEMDQKEFEGEMKDCAIEKARRTKETEMKTQEKQRLSGKIDEMSKQRKHVSAELEAVNQYLKDLRPACVEGDSTYEDRKASRATEIDALKQAQGILADAFKEGPGAPASAPAAAFLAPVM